MCSVIYSDTDRRSHIYIIIFHLCAVHNSIPWKNYMTHLNMFLIYKIQKASIFHKGIIISVRLLATKTKFAGR